MTDLDLAEAVEAAAKTAYERGGSRWDGLGPVVRHVWREAYLDVVAAAGPIIAAQAVAYYRQVSESGAAAIHVCDATCLCGGRCAETQALRDLIARSSLGSPEAAALRESIPPELAERALRRAAEMERDAAIAERDALRDRILDSLVWKGDEVLALLDDGKEESL